jgi:hypothetical protein
VPWLLLHDSSVVPPSQSIAQLSPPPAFLQVSVHSAPVSQTTEHGGSLHVTVHVDPALQVAVVDVFGDDDELDTMHAVPGSHTNWQVESAQTRGSQGHCGVHSMVHEAPPAHAPHEAAAASPGVAASPASAPPRPPSMTASISAWASAAGPPSSAAADSP